MAIDLEKLYQITYQQPLDRIRSNKRLDSAARLLSSGGQFYKKTASSADDANKLASISVSTYNAKDYFMKFSFLAFLLLLTQPLMSQETLTFFNGDETLLIKVKADPGEYVGKPIVFMGMMSFSDYYNYEYLETSDRFYSIRCWEIIKKKENDPSNVAGQALALGENVKLYLDRKFKPVADILIEQSKGNDQVIRVKAVIDPKRYKGDSTPWDMMEVIDVQIPVDGKLTPWLIDPLRKKEQEGILMAKEDALRAREQANAEVAQKAADEKMAMMEKKKNLDEERRIAWTRTWKDKSGNFSIDAEMLKMSNGVLTLKRVSDGVEIKVSLENLSQECNDWVSEAIRKR